MVRRLLALGLLAAPAAFALDRWLAARRGDRPPRAMDMLEVVDAPINETWAVISDIPRQPEWMREMKRVAITTPGPVGVGTRGEATVRILGIGVSDPVEITAFEQPRLFAIRHEGLFTGGGVITLEAGTDGTTTIVRWTETLVPPVLPELGALVQAPVLQAIFQDDLHRLKRLVETGSADG
ncbi:MAG TPA: SRPBCC family protein [Candidatus Limnocylindrales bacterium]